jgi:EAL domain-containing protein (putative c-di-GMP-specific phosphodiesterase class I)
MQKNPSAVPPRQHGGSGDNTTPARDLRNTIAQVIETQAFQAVFQPIVTISDRSVVAHEALTRFDDGCPPELRFKEANEVGLGDELALATLAEALRMANQLPHGPSLHINVAPAVLKNDQFAPLIATATRPVVIELTEHEPIDDYLAFSQLLDGLDGDIRLAVDDAGAGYASMSHILSLHPHEVKLDRDWISGIDRDSRRQALVQGLVHFGRSTGTTLVAEGVESEVEAKMLQELGIERAQGNLFGTPLPPAGVRKAAADNATATDRVAATSRLLTMLSGPLDATVTEAFRDLSAELVLNGIERARPGSSRRK